MLRACVSDLPFFLRSSNPDVIVMKKSIDARCSYIDESQPTHRATTSKRTGAF